MTTGVVSVVGLYGGDDGGIAEIEDKEVGGTVVVDGVAVVATTVVDDVSGPTEVDVDAEASGVTVVDSADDAILVAVVPGPVLVVTVSDVVTTTVAYWSQ